MLPTPIISTETVASCAEATQTEALKTIDANRNRFVIHQVILAPLARTPKIGCCASSSDRDFYRNAATNDARKVRGTIQGSVNADSLQHHHELGCSVTNEGGVSFLPLALEGARAMSETSQACPDMNEAANQGGLGMTGAGRCRAMPGHSATPGISDLYKRPLQVSRYLRQFPSPRSPNASLLRQACLSSPHTSRRTGLWQVSRYLRQFPSPRSPSASLFSQASRNCSHCPPRPSYTRTPPGPTSMDWEKAEIGITKRAAAAAAPNA
jgi:hypothetical protein